MDVKQEFLHRVDEVFPEDQRGKIREALAVSEECHKGQTRDEGTSYIVHPIRVGLILLDELGIIDAESIITALLHDVVEDSDIAEEELEARFGAKVAHAVKMLTKPVDDDLSKDERNKLYMESLAKAEPAIQRIKLSDRLDNVRGLHLSPNVSKHGKYWKETQELYIPFARNSGSKYLYEALRKWCDKFGMERGDGL